MEWFVGCDVSKLTLDVTVLNSDGRITRFKIPNVPVEHDKLLRRVTKMAGQAPVHWCMEATGPYHWRFAMHLVEAGELVSVENPRRVKHFAVAIGAVQKTDRADADSIARYAQQMRPRPWQLAEPLLRELTFLDRRITDLHQLTTQESNRLEHPCLPEVVKNSILDSVAQFKRQIQLLERRIEELVGQDQELGKSVELLRTITGIGPRSAIGLLVEAGDLSRYDEAQDLAAAFGLHPQIRRSGTSLHGKTRISKAGNAHARSRLYMPTVVATKHNPVIRDFYTKLVAAHKPKKSALIGCERKLVMIAYGVLKSRKPFDPMHGKLTN